MRTVAARAAGFGTERLRLALGPAFQAVHAALADAGVLPTAAPIAFYEGDAEADSLIAYAGVPIGDQSLPAASDAEVVVLSAIEAATVVRRGDATEPQAYYALLARHIEDHGYRLDGHGRDILIAIPDDRTEQVVEMQLPMKRPTN